MKDIRRTCNPTIRFSKFTLNIKIYEEFEEFLFVGDVFATRAENARMAQISHWVL